MYTAELFTVAKYGYNLNVHLQMNGEQNVYPYNFFVNKEHSVDT